MKNDQYFNLEVNFMEDDELAVMMLELGAAKALGVYVMLLLHLRKKDEYEASCRPAVLKTIAERSRMDLELIKRVILEFDVFEVDEERQTFRSPYLDKVMKSLEERRRICAENGKKGGRPKRVEEGAETPMDKGKKPNVNQKSRVEESRRITTVEYNSSNTGAMLQTAAVDDGRKKGESTPSNPAGRRVRICPIDEEGQRPLQPVENWEKLVDRLAASESYMELAGQHSGLGSLFIHHRSQIIRLFKAHIRLYGKTADLLFPEDVRRYFSNYIAAGSTSCRMLREALLAEIREKNDWNDGRFENIVDGRRTYLGHPIPDDAPPRPDAAAVWDDVRKKWGH